MVFFKQFRNYIICFLLFGVWSSWQNFQYKKLLRTYLVLHLLVEFSSYVLTTLKINIYGAITFTSFIANSSFLLIMLVQLVISFESFFKSEAQVQIIQKFSLVDKLFFRKLDLNIVYRKERREIFVRNMLLISMILSIKVILWWYTRFVKPVLSFLYCTMYSSWIMRLRWIQVLLFVSLVRNRLFLINKELVNIQNTTNVPIENQDKFSSSILIVNSLKRCNYERLIHLKQIYGKLYEINELINAIFGWSYLVIVIQNFFDFTSNCYWIFLIIEGSLPNDEVLIICIILLLPNAITLITLAFFCTSCSYQVRLLLLFIAVPSFLNESLKAMIHIILLLKNFFCLRPI